MPDRFDWNPDKAAANLQKHGVSFEEAAEVFDDPYLLIEYDETHSIHEPRFNVIGYSTRRRVLFVVTTDRPDFIRVISARRATPAERRRYEENRR